ncbi:MAG TPA: hypothetical protein ENJ52_12675 [Aliiroseovarius sp.]|nr:hypothetical protein [Aliiroseovarius sp.]
MNQSKRAFLKTGAALICTASLAPAQALAFGSDAIRVMVTVEDGKTGTVKREFKVGKDDQHKLCEAEGRERAALLTEAILEGIRKEFRGEPWLKDIREMVEPLQSQIERKLKDAGADTGEPQSIVIVITITIGDRKIIIRMEF